MTTKDLYEQMVAHYDINPDEFADVLEQMDSWNGYLNGERWEPMDCFDELHYGLKPLELAERLDNSNFCTNHDYFRYDSLGRIESSDERDYSDYLYTSNMEDIFEYYENGHLDVDSYIEELFEEYENSQEEEDDLADDELEDDDV